MSVHIATEVAQATINALPGILATGFWRHMDGRLRARRRAARQVRCTNPVRRRGGVGKGSVPSAASVPTCTSASRVHSRFRRN